MQLMQRGIQDEIALAEAEDRAFLDHPPVIVAPGGIGDLHRLDLGHVAGDQEIDEARRVAAADGIFDQRRDVIDRGAVADGEIFRLLGIEEGGRLEAHPADPALAMHQPLDGRMEGRLAQEGRQMLDMGHAAPLRGFAFTCFKISRAALAPGRPETLPPGWAPAPQSQRPGTGMRYC